MVHPTEFDFRMPRGKKRPCENKRKQWGQDNMVKHPFEETE
jgi:hypothetical protein